MPNDVIPLLIIIAWLALSVALAGALLYRTRRERERQPRGSGPLSGSSARRLTKPR